MTDSWAEFARRGLHSILTGLDQAAGTRYLGGLPEIHGLHGDRAGPWAVRVSNNWRVIFRFEDGSTRDIDLMDYSVEHHAHALPDTLWIRGPRAEDGSRGHGGHGLDQVLRAKLGTVAYLGQRVFRGGPSMALVAHRSLEICNTDPSRQCTSAACTGRVEPTGARVSMEGRGRCLSNICIEH